MSAQTKLTANDFQISHGRASHFQQDHNDSQQDRSYSTPLHELHESILFSLIRGAVETQSRRICGPQASPVVVRDALCRYRFASQ
jgi:hypothetical protein